MPPSSGQRDGARSGFRLGPQDVGRRVTVRRVLPDGPPLPDGRPPLGDVVGVLEAWEDGTLRVRRRSGEQVEVPVDTVVLGRPVRGVDPPPGRGPRR